VTVRLDAPMEVNSFSVSLHLGDRKYYKALSPAKKLKMKNIIYLFQIPTLINRIPRLNSHLSSYTVESNEIFVSLHLDGDYLKQAA